VYHQEKTRKITRIFLLTAKGDGAFSRTCWFTSKELIGVGETLLSARQLKILLQKFDKYSTPRPDVGNLNVSL
jgi:hypothetical protein